MKKLKKRLSVILMSIMFVVGLLVFFYPQISDYFNNKNCSKMIQSYTEKVNEIDHEAIDAELEEARTYNSQLYEHMIILTDPFDPNAFPITDEQYEDVLDLDEVMAYLEIPAIDVYLPIYHGTKPETLEKGVGHLENTSLPVGGASTHTVLSAHCGLPSAVLFTNLDRLQIGNVFKIHVLNQTLVYQVSSIEIVLPEDCSTLYINRGEDTATLMTCTPYGENTHRLLVHGSRVADEQVEEVVAEEPSIEKKMTLDEWMTISMIVLCSIFALLMLMITIKQKRIKSRNKADSKSEQAPEQPNTE